MKSKIRFFWCLVCFFTTSCVMAPSVQDASYLDPKEVALVSHIVKGKEYSLSGRAALAEREFRLALKQRPKMDMVLNDLGYALLSQNRFDEAGELFEQSLALNPKNVIARDNYAKLLYRNGNFSASIEQYHLLLETLFSTKKSELKDVLGEEFNESELVNIFRNLSSAYFALGYYGEAVCYSDLARQRQPDAFQVSLHARMLMSLGKTHEAYNVLNATIVGTRANVPSFMLVDYGILLVELRDYNRARESFSRALSGARLNRRERTAAWLGTIYAAQQLEKTKEVKLLTEQLLTTQDQLCEEVPIVEESYWPLEFGDKLEILKNEVCGT